MTDFQTTHRRKLTKPDDAGDPLLPVFEDSSIPATKSGNQKKANAKPTSISYILVETYLWLHHIIYERCIIPFVLYFIRFGNDKKRWMKDFFKYKSGEDSRTAFENFSISSRTRLKENRLYLFIFFILFAASIVFYLYMSGIVMEDYVKDKREQFWDFTQQNSETLSFSNEDNTISLWSPGEPLYTLDIDTNKRNEDEFRKEDANFNLLCHSNKSVEDYTRSYIVGIDSLHPWVPVCISSCFSFGLGDSIIEQQEGDGHGKKGCTSYQSRVENPLNFYGRLANTPIKYMRFHGNCLRGPNRVCDMNSAREGDCNCNCKIPSILSIHFPISDFIMWNLINLNSGNVFYIDDSKLLFINYTESQISENTIDAMSLIGREKVSKSEHLAANKEDIIIEESESNENEMVEATKTKDKNNDIDFSDESDDLKHIYQVQHQNEDKAAEKADNLGFLSILSRMGDGVSKITGNDIGRKLVDAFLDSSDTNDKNVKSFAVVSKDESLWGGYRDLTFSEKANLLSVYFTSLYSGTKKLGNLVVCGDDTTHSDDCPFINNLGVISFTSTSYSFASFCDCNKQMLSQRSIKDTVSYIKNKDQNEKLNSLMKLYEERVRHLAPSFFERYVIIRMKILDLIHAQVISPIYMEKINFNSAPFSFRDSLTKKLETTTTTTTKDKRSSNNAIPLTIFSLNSYYYKSFGSLDTSLWSPFFSINDPDFVLQISKARNYTRSSSPYNSNQGTVESHKRSQEDNVATGGSLFQYIDQIEKIGNMFSEMASEFMASGNGANGGKTSMKQYDKNKKPHQSKDDGEGEDGDNIDSPNPGIDTPVQLDTNIITRNLMTSRFITSNGKIANMRDIYGAYISHNSPPPSHFYSDVIKMMEMDKRSEDIVGELYYLDPLFIDNILNQLQSEYTQLIQVIKNYNKRISSLPNSLRNKKQEKVSTNLRFCSCGFHSMLPLGIVFTGFRDLKQKFGSTSNSINVRSWFKPRVIDRNNLLHPQVDLTPTFLEDTYVKEGRKIPKTLKIEWTRDIYTYEYLHKMVKEDWKNIQTIIENDSVNPDGIVPFSTLYTHAIMANHFDKSIIAKSVYSVFSKNETKMETDDTLGNNIIPMTPNVYSILEHYIQEGVVDKSSSSRKDGKGKIVHTKKHSKTSILYESQCIDYCTSTWAMFSEASFVFHHKDILKESQRNGSPVYRCDKNGVKKCNSMWSKFGNS